MRYLIDGPFEGHLAGEGQTISATFAGLAGSYVPIRGLTLKTADIRKLNRAIDILEAGPDKSGVLALEDEDFQVLRQVVIALAENSNMARSAPIVEDILNAAESRISTHGGEPTRLTVTERSDSDTESGSTPKRIEVAAGREVTGD